MLKISNLHKKHEKNTLWPMEKKIEAVTAYLATGNMRIVSAAIGVDYQLCRFWKTQQWWKEYEYEIKNAKRSDTNNKFTKIIDKSLEIVADRLENGEMILNNKTGELMRKPIGIKDAIKVTTDIFNHQLALDKVKQDESSLQKQESIQDTLKQLADEFAKFNGTKKPAEIIEAEDVEFKENDHSIHEEREEGLQDPIREVRRETGSDQEESGTELSAESTLQGGLSPKGGW